MTKKIEIITANQQTFITEEVNIAKNSILGASNPNELKEALNTLVRIKEAIRMGKDKLKEIDKEPKEQIKFLDNLAVSLEEDIKKHFENVRDIKIETYFDKETGEQKHREITNYDSGLFTFTPEKSNVVLDRERLLEFGKKSHNAGIAGNRLHEKLVIKKVVYEIDEQKLEDYIAENGFEGLPTFINKTQEKIGIQYAQIKSKLLDGSGKLEIGESND